VTTPRAALTLAAAAVLGLAACGASGDLDEAMDAVCGGAEVETTGDASPDDGSGDGSDDGLVEEQECDSDVAPLLTGAVYDEDPHDVMGDLSDAAETGDGLFLWRAEKEVGGQWVVVHMTTPEAGRPEELAPLEDLGFDIIG